MKKIMLLMAISTIAFAACTKKPQTGEIGFYTRAQGVGPVQLYINGEHRGTINVVFTQTPDCSHGQLLKIEMEEGTHNVEARVTSGSANYKVKFTAHTCRVFAL